MSHTDPADLGVVEAASLLGTRELSAAELVGACLRRIRERDGAHSHAGDPDSVNAWIRVYEREALEAAERADARPPADRPPLCGIPVGLKDLFAAAGKPLTASSRVLHDLPARDSDVWARLSGAGMVLLGHLHTHEFAVGGTTDQVGNPWALERSAGGSSGGSAAALAARMVPAATGTDTAGSLRIPSAMCATSTIKPTRRSVSLRGVVPLAPTLDHAGPMARTLTDCAALLAEMAGPDPGRPGTALATGLGAAPAARSLDGTRLALSPRIPMVSLDPDVADGFELLLETCRALGATLVEPPPPLAPLDVAADFLDVLCAELAAYHRRFGDTDRYRPALREWVTEGDRRATSAIDYAAAQARRRELIASWSDWLVHERVAALLEPTVPTVAPLRGTGYDHAGSDWELISLTHYWSWAGFPVVALPACVGSRGGLPVGVSLVGPAGADWDLLAIGIELQAQLGVPEPP